MVRVMAVSFERHGLLHFLDPGESDYGVGDWVLFPTSAGPEVAQCVWPAQEVESTGFDGLPKCLGEASESDLMRDAANRRWRAVAKQVAQELVNSNELPMKIVAVDYIDRSPDFDQQAVIYFTAPHRVDFRILLGDLAKTLQSRIDLRQVGARDVARLLGGVGSCGRQLCCTSFLTEFEPISMRLPRMQFLPSVSPQIMGNCGKLLCCLKFEHPLYVDFLRAAPAQGELVEGPEGEAKVIGHRVPDETVLLRSPCGQTMRCGLDQITRKQGPAD